MSSSETNHGAHASRVLPTASRRRLRSTIYPHRLVEKRWCDENLRRDAANHTPEAYAPRINEMAIMKNLKIQFWTGTVVLSVLSAASLWLFAPAAFAADEVCASCSAQVSVSGDFAHRKSNPSVAIEGAGADAAPFREDINGKNFIVTIAHLPAGKYTIAIGEVEITASAAGDRVFDVTAGDVSLAKNFDIFATAGAARKVCYINGAIEHEDDSLKGPVKISFSASKGNAKFNTFEVKNSSGASVIAFSASELADAFSAAAMRVPDISEPPIWRDPSHPLKDRANDLIRRMSLAEKVAQLKNGAPGIPRLGLPAYDYWNEALHGVANNGIATVFPEPVGGAASWNPELFHAEGTVIGVEGRAKFNDYANAHNGDSKWWYGMTFWTPNINIFRDPRWGRGQETYGEDPFLTSEIGIEFVKGIQGDDPNYMLSMACAKHYAVHSGPESQRHRFDAVPSDRDLYETYLPQFERVVREGQSRRRHGRLQLRLWRALLRQQIAARRSAAQAMGI